MIKGMKSVDKVFLSKKALNNYMSKRAEAFSIAELAVVVAAVGLLSFGVLKSGELVTNARVKSVLHEIQEIKNGVSSYRIANDYLPGDNPSIDSTGNNYILREDGDPANQINFSGFGQGNGDGIITYGATTTGTGANACYTNDSKKKLSNESTLAFAQMVLAGYLTGGISNTPSLYDTNGATTGYAESLGAGYQSSKLSGVYYSFLGVKSTATNVFLSKSGDFGNFNGTNIVLGGVSGTPFATTGTAPSDIIILNTANTVTASTSYFTNVVASSDCGITAFATLSLPTPTKAVIAPKIVDGIKAALGSQVRSCSSPTEGAAGNCSTTDDQVVSVPLY